MTSASAAAVSVRCFAPVLMTLAPTFFISDRRRGAGDTSSDIFAADASADLDIRRQGFYLWLILNL
jgi:hypothetical protein